MSGLSRVSTKSRRLSKEHSDLMPAVAQMPDPGTRNQGPTRDTHTHSIYIYVHIDIYIHICIYIYIYVFVFRFDPRHSLSLFLSLSGREERGESESERELNPQGFCLSDGAIDVGILRVCK